ncbi:MAG: PAS domain S-box protein, partial [Archaeoglobaceae archaeon]|nr:PAS domain S-box protein [Archaeoglobaceae archaeon]MDW8118959.1 PAS domain S-box protein [Archaeoglobaceae archaeon]
FPNLLKKLENGEIDLMTAIAYSEERAKLFNFTNETVLSNWGVIVAKRQYNSILELSGLKVAGVSRDIYTESFKRLSKDFELNCEILEIEGDYKQVLEAVRDGYAEFGIVSRLYGYFHAKEYGLECTNIIFSPISLKFASKNKDLLSVIDKHLAEMKGDGNSIYYKSLDKWLGVKPEFIPRWFYQIIAIGVIILLAMFIGNVYLGREVRKRTEKIAENERFLRAVYDATQDGICVIDPKMNIISVNKAVENWFGKGKAIIGKKCFEVFQNLRSPCDNCPSIKAMKSGKIESSITLAPSRDQVIWLEVFSSPIFDGRGNIQMVVLFLRDITTKKIAEDKLKEAYELYDMLWENSNDLLVYHNLKEGYVKMNKKARELFGYEVDKRIELSELSNLADPKYYEIAKRKMEEVFNTKKATEPFELLLRAKDGKEIWLEVFMYPVIKEGEIIGLHVVARDITDRKKLIEQLEKNTMLIAHLVDKIKNPLTVARAFCELHDKVGDEGIEKAIQEMDIIIDLLRDLEKAWIESERLRDLLFGRKT